MIIFASIFLEEMGLIRFLKDWTLPVAIATGTICYLTFYYTPQLDELGNRLSPVFDIIFPISVFLTLFVTFCKVDFHEMRPHRWHIGVLVAQLLMVAAIVMICLSLEDRPDSKLVWEAMLTCVIGPSAAAAPVVVGKLGGNISTMTTYGEGVVGTAVAFGVRMADAALCEGCLCENRSDA